MNIFHPLPDPIQCTLHLGVWLHGEMDGAGANAPVAQKLLISEMILLSAKE